MTQTFTTEKLEKRLKFLRTISFIIILMGIILLGFKDYKNFNNFASLGSFLDTFLFIGLGLFLFLWVKNQMKLLPGFINFNENEFSFKSRQKEMTYQKSQIKNIKIGLKEIEIISVDDAVSKIHLDDYLNYSDKKEIKATIASFKN